MAGKGRPFQPGQPRPLGSGRKPGTPNKTTTHLKELLEAKGFDTIDRLIAEWPHIDPNKRVDICMGLLKFLYPTKLSATVSNQDGSALFPRPLSHEQIAERLDLLKGKK